MVEVLGRAAVESLSEIATTSLGLDPPSVVGSSDRLPTGKQGALISLLSDAPATLGVFGTSDSCATLARSFLGMAAGETLTREDMADGVSEIANIIAGGMKRRAGSFSSARIGLPVFVMGDVLFLHGVEVSSVGLRLGQATLTLSVISKVVVYK